MLVYIILTASIVINLIPAFFVILNDRRSVTHQNFFILTLTFISYGLVNFISFNPLLLDQIYWIRLDLALAVYLFMYLYLTFMAFPERKAVKQSPLGTLFIIYSILISFFVFTPFVFSGLENTANGVQPVAAPGIMLFVLQQFGAIVLTAITVRKKFKKSDADQRKHLRLVVIGTAVSVATILICNLVAVQAFKTNALVPFSSIGVLAFTISFSYSLIRYKFLNVRLIVARTLGYILSLGSLVVLYSMLSQYALGFVIASGSRSANILSNVLVLIFGILSYQPMKRFFDKVTNALFYRDAYDPQTFLDQLNKTLVGNIEIGILLRHTALVIEENLKAECHIYVKETENSSARLMGTSQKHIKPSHLELMKNELLTMSNNTIVTEDLEQHYSHLRSVLEQNNIAVISSLITSYASGREATAYLMLGPKKSGNAYSRPDRRIIDIISDELLIAIQNALRFEEIQSFNITLQNRINDATAKLKRSNAKLKEMDETKDEFISMASHQLRTPLTSVKGYLSMVLDGDAGKLNDNQQQLLKQAYLSSQRMVYLIADLLNVSRLKTGKFIIEASPTNLADLVEGEIAQLKEVARGRKLSLAFHKPDSFPELMLDETKTRQVIMNFIDNSIYYTPSGGKIKVELRYDRSSVYFMVKDNGLGVPKEEQPHLFSKFYRAKNAQKARPDGTGLGLFMAKKVIAEQGGTILFESTEGKGSTFGFKFERSKNAVPAKSAGDDKDK